jgi:hypothetical protein
MEERLWTFRLLVGMADANKVIGDEERRLLETAIDAMFDGAEERERALEAIRTPPDLTALLANTPSPMVTSQSFGYRILTECVSLAAADNDISGEECAFLFELGRFYRFDPDFVSMLIEGGKPSTEAAPTAP